MSLTTLNLDPLITIAKNDYKYFERLIGFQSLNIIYRNYQLGKYTVKDLLV